MGLGIVLQARKGSTRLPNKMSKTFYRDQSLLEVILRKLISIGESLNVPVILATTTNSKDDELEDIAKNLGVEVFRGSENDVLDRFIQASEKFNLQKIIRVCGDNPFLLSEDIKSLIEDFSTKKDLDYMSFKVNGKPSILTHFGLWTEAVTLQALKKVASESNDAFYHEHVTNYVYSNSNNFKVDWIVLNDVKFANEKVRLTIDTDEDFELVSSIYEELNNESKEFDLSELLNYIESRPEILKKMGEIIEKNTK